MKARTLAYGTRRDADISTKGQQGEFTFLLLVNDLSDEAFILIAEERFDEVAECDRVTIEFTAGGPTGGYWKIVDIRKAGEEVPF